MEPAATTTSCPSCGIASAASAARCSSCGFVFFDAPTRRRPPTRVLAVAAAGLALAGAIALLLSRDDSAPGPAPAPLAAASAERRLERQLGFSGDDDTAAVSCARSIRPGRQTRCQIRYPNGDTQLILVGLSRAGDLDVEIPYPAQRRPGG